MRSTSRFLIESASSRHRLFLNEKEIATFASLDAAEAEANLIANLAAPGIALQFQLDFKWTLSDLELRTASLPDQSKTQAQCGPSSCSFGISGASTGLESTAGGKDVA
jgi:hypothetical protein